MSKLYWAAGGVALALAVLLGYSLPHSASLGGTGIHVLQEDFRVGLKIGGSAFSDSSRNLSNVGTISSGIITDTGEVNSGNSTVAGTLAVTGQFTTASSVAIGGGVASSVAAFVLADPAGASSTIVLGSRNKALCELVPGCVDVTNCRSASDVWRVNGATSVFIFAAKPAWCR